MRVLLGELRKLSLYQVGAAYAAVGWLLVELALVLLPTFGAPAWVPRVTALLVILGFPLALLFAWAFDFTRQSPQRTSNVAIERSITRHADRELDFAIVGLLVVALGVSLYLNLRLAPATERAATIAVLPFTNGSADALHAIFADGIHDELLTSLASIGSLQVISRTSVMEYRGSKAPHEVGEQLGVANLLEGTVQREGDSVRISVKLIDAQTDENLWAETYDREMTTGNLSAIQSEIATAVADKLKATVTPDDRERLARVPTGNLQAYELYLAGRQNLYQRRLDNIVRAREAFEQAIALDPRFAKAYSSLSDTLNVLYVNFGVPGRDAVFRRSKALLDAALALDPDDPEIHASLGLLASNRWHATQSTEDLTAALRAYQQAISLNPNDAQALAWYGALELYRGQYAHAIELFERSLRFDPLARVSQLNLADSYAGLGNHRKALDLMLACARRNSDWPAVAVVIAEQLMYLGRLDEALAWSYRARPLGDDPSTMRSAIRIYAAFGDGHRAAELARQTRPNHPLWTLKQAVALQAEGDSAGALVMLEDTINSSDDLSPQYLNAAADLATLEGNLKASRGYFERVCPRLLDPAPGFDDLGLCSAPGYAFVLQRLGERRRAAQVLEEYLTYTQDRARLGIKGYGIADVEALALLGRRTEALQRLREAIDAGWRTPWPRHAWSLALDPYLSRLRDDARFSAMIVETDADIARMRERAAEAEARSDWEPLLALAEAGEGRRSPLWVR